MVTRERYVSICNDTSREILRRILDHHLHGDLQAPRAVHLADDGLACITDMLRAVPFDGLAYSATI